MKLAYFDDWIIGVVQGEGVVDVTAALTHLPHRDRKDLMEALIRDFANCGPKIAAAAKAGKAIPLGDVKLRAPLPRPRQIDCMAVNYMEDGTLPAAPPINAFQKSPSAVIGPEETMILPDIPATVFEGEAEMAVVIGRPASNISETDAMSHVFGYVNFIDGSARGLPPEGNTFYQTKSRETFAPMGPWIVTADEISDPQNLQIRLWVNGKIRQDFNTSDMAHNIRKSIAWVSSVHSLEPGDVLATGTNHRGLSAFHDGDVVEMETEGLGRLRFNIRDDLKRTWSRDSRLEGSEKLRAAGGKPPLTGVTAKQLTGRYAPTS
jgi:2-keto-4-pentenoate hydratase/2-oxohepta-3-ene-1,7-dioic acid hydratase in catechol pathway